MKNTIRILCLGAAITAGSSTMSLAGDDAGTGMHDGHRGGPQFEKLDVDGDGQITKSDLEAHRQARFDRADSDGDGKISKAELLETAQKRAEKRVAWLLKRQDTDGDGALSPVEMDGGHHKGRMLERLDSDGDGAVTKAEFDMAMKKMKAHRKGGHKADDTVE